MAWRRALLGVLFSSLFLCGAALANTAATDALLVLPELVLVTLPRAEGQEFKVSYTSHPMKVIVDSNLPLGGLPEQQLVSDVALREIRIPKAQTALAGWFWNSTTSCLKEWSGSTAIFSSWKYPKPL